MDLPATRPQPMSGTISCARRLWRRRCDPLSFPRNRESGGKLIHLDSRSRVPRDREWHRADLFQRDRCDEPPIIRLAAMRHAAIRKEAALIRVSIERKVL